MNDAEAPEPHLPVWRARLRRILRAMLRPPALVLVAIYFLIDDVVLAAFRPIVAWAAELRIVLRFAVFLRRLPPYPTLMLFLVPFVVLEPFKLGGLWLMATGRFAPGLVMLVIAHVASIVLVERLFQATRDKLLTIGWFARAYGLVMRLYDWSLGRLRATAAWRRATATLAALRVRVATLAKALRESRFAGWLSARLADLRLRLLHWKIRFGRPPRA